MPALTRRRLLIGGGAGVGVLVAYALWPRRFPTNLVAGPGETLFGPFLKIGVDGTVTAVVPQAEIGQGAWTGLAQAVADELGADWRTVAVEPAPISPAYANAFLLEGAAREAAPAWLGDAAAWTAHEVAVRQTLMITGGSTSIRGFEAPMRAAAAAARALLCKAAAAHWDADWQACDTQEGFVVRGPDRLRFGEVAADAARYDVPDTVVLRPPGTGGISGRSVPRLDLPAKVDGSARFAADVRLPGMLFASVRQGPVGAAPAELIDCNLAAAKPMPGVAAVIRTRHWVAVLAETWWAADRAADLLRPRFRQAGAPADSAAIAQALDVALAAGGGRVIESGDPDDVVQGGATLQARYAVAPAAHAAIEPLCATARLVGDRLEVWAPTQAQALARSAAARAVSLPESAVTLYPMLIGGGFGRKVETDAIEQVALLAAKSGRPVQLTWSREEETVHARGRPPAIAALSARLSGRAIAGWHARIATPSAGAAMMRRVLPSLPDLGDRPEASSLEGAVPPYAIPAVAIDHCPVRLPIGSGMWRSVAHSYTAFFTESFVDELAAAARVDALAFRLSMLGDSPRLARCLQAAAARGGWGSGTSQGLAALTAFGSHVAMLVEASVAPDRTIRVARVVAAVDCGRVIHPDIVRQQVEGGILWGLAAALGMGMDYRGGAAVQRNFDTLALPGLAECPEIAIEILPSREAPGGVGELGVPPVAPALANALAAATGKRFRSLPLKA